MATSRRDQHSPFRARLFGLAITVTLAASSCTKEEVLRELAPGIMPTLRRYGMADHYEALVGPLAQSIANWINMQLRARGIAV